MPGCELCQQLSGPLMRLLCEMPEFIGSRFPSQEDRERRRPVVYINFSRMLGQHFSWSCPGYTWHDEGRFENIEICVGRADGGRIWVVPDSIAWQNLQDRLRNAGYRNAWGAPWNPAQRGTHAHPNPR